MLLTTRCKDPATTIVQDSKRKSRSQSAASTRVRGRLRKKQEFRTQSSKQNRKKAAARVCGYTRRERGFAQHTPTYFPLLSLDASSPFSLSADQRSRRRKHIITLLSVDLRRRPCMCVDVSAHSLRLAISRRLAARVHTHMHSHRLRQTDSPLQGKDARSREGFEKSLAEAERQSHPHSLIERTEGNSEREGESTNGGS